jgi:hypothetical protein
MGSDTRGSQLEYFPAPAAPQLGDPPARRRHRIGRLEQLRAVAAHQEWRGPKDREAVPLTRPRAVAAGRRRRRQRARAGARVIPGLPARRVHLRVGGGKLPRELRLHPVEQAGLASHHRAPLAAARRPRLQFDFDGDTVTADGSSLDMLTDVPSSLELIGDRRSCCSHAFLGDPEDAVEDGVRGGCGPAGDSGDVWRGRGLAGDGGDVGEERGPANDGGEVA